MSRDKIFNNLPEAAVIKESFPRGNMERNQLMVQPGDWIVLSLTQPWASALFVAGLKRIETRGWRTNHRGRLYIHASKGYPKWAREFTAQEFSCGRLPSKELPLGYIIGHVELVDMKPTSDIAEKISQVEALYGDYAPGRWAWITADPLLLPEPIPATGQLGLWRFPQ